ncbi:MAG: D-threo-aldose 1-dehydrogenase [Chitinophagaceae bacterium]|nr:D-threo-aldose 1-dehydrogenase [Chitinophagaceae bacterium]
MKQEKTASTTSGHYRLPYHFGLGGVPIGNEFSAVTDAEAQQTLEAAWDAGVRYYDVSPWYGLGLAERRFGQFLHNQKRSEYVISSKVGKLLKASKKAIRSNLFPLAGSPNMVEFDYSAAAVRRSIEDSLQRLGIDSLDIVFVHDLSPDNKYLEGAWLGHFEIATQGAFPELTRMREEGLIKAWGLGVNRPEPILATMEVADPDIFLLASQYSLIDHEYALKNIFPKVRKKNIQLVMGSALNAGFISGSNRYNYGHEMPNEFIVKRDHLAAIANAYDVDLRTAALQFAAMPDVAAAVLCGARTAQQITEDIGSMKVKIPADFWAELKAEKLISEEAPVK